MRFPFLSKQNHPLAALCSALWATATGHIGLCLLQWRACCTQHRASFAEIVRKALIKESVCGDGYLNSSVIIHRLCSKHVGLHVLAHYRFRSCLFLSRLPVWSATGKTAPLQS